MKFDGQYYRALIGTASLIILIAFGSDLLSHDKFSFMWFIGAINIMGCFTILLHINYKFIVFTKDEVSRGIEKNEKAS